MSVSPTPSPTPGHRPSRDGLSPFSPMVADLHGCLWLDNPPGPERLDGKKWTGWAAIGGAEAFRFSGIEQLPVDVVWWTNLDQGETWSLGRWRRFKSGSLLGPDWSALMTEVAPSEALKSPQIWVSRWSECFARVAERLSRWAAGDKVHEPWSWGEGQAVESLGSRWSQWKDPTADPLSMVLEKAYTPIVRLNWPESALRGYRQLHLSRSRWTHARSVLSHRVPVGEWTVLDDQWPRSGQARWSWVRQHTQPLLLELEFLGWRQDGENHEAQGRLRLGHRGQAFNPIPVESIWMTAEEALELEVHGEWNILKGFLGTGWGQVDGLPDWWSADPGPLTPWSLTYGLLSSLSWKALASPVRAEESRKKGAVSAQALWLRAADRSLCWQSAQVMQNRGYMVLRYGEDGVDLAFDPDGDPKKLVSALREADLRLPRALASMVEFKSIDNDPNGLHVEWVIDSWMKKMGDEAIGWDVDRLVAPWPGKGVQAVLQESAKSLDGLGIEKTLPGLQELWKKNLRAQARLSVDRLKATINRDK